MNSFAGKTRVIGRYQGKGFTLSVIVHLLIIGAIVSATASIRPVQKLMVVDFSLIEGSARVKASTQRQKQPAVATNSAAPPVKKTTPPKAPKIVVREMPLPQPPTIIAAPKPKVTAIAKTAAPQVIKPEPIPEPKPAAEKEMPAEVEKIAEPAPLSSESPAQVVTTPLASKKTRAEQLFDFPAPAAGTPRPTNDATTTSKYTAAHFNHIQKGIQKHIKYPRAARRMGWEGKVVVEFIICIDGTVKNIRVVESSGFSALDKNAVATIKEVAPFPIPPVPAKLTIPVVYRLS